MNKEAFNDFWFWINERQKIYLKKEAGEPRPWTADPILNEWKFCNVLRTQDTETKYLIHHIIDGSNEVFDSAGDVIFNIFTFRAFNRHETYEVLRGPDYGNYGAFPADDWLEKLDSIVSSGGQITSGAYMIRGREGMHKYESIVRTLAEVFTYRETVAADIFASKHSMEKAYKYLQSYNFWGWGPFTLYQILLDLTYTPMLSDPGDINNWCIFGPGAARGLREIWPDIKRGDFLTGAKSLTYQQEDYLDPTIWKAPLTLQDIEFSLCELGKYRRIKNGGKGKERYGH